MSLNAMSMTVKCDNSLCGKEHYEDAPTYLTLTSKIEVFGEWPEKHFCDEICAQLYLQGKSPIVTFSEDPDMDALTKVVARRIGVDSPWGRTHISDILTTAWSVMRTRVHWDVENAKVEAYKLGFKVAVEMHQCDGEGSWCDLCEKVEQQKAPQSEN